MLYLYNNKYSISPYNGEILKRYINNKMIKAISNPTEQDLKEFGYMNLVESSEPEYNVETQYLEISYQIIDNTIHQLYEIRNIELNNEIENIITNE